jgi:hypothetical protein
MNILLLILKLFPMLIDAIQTIETSAPVAKVGPAKAALLQSVVASAYTAGKVDPKLISQDQLLALLQTIAAEIVSFYNLIGIFKTTPVVVSTAPAVPPVATVSGTPAA